MKEPHRFQAYAHDWPNRWLPYIWDVIAVPAALRPLTGDGAPEAYATIARLARCAVVDNQAEGIIAEVGIRAGGGIYAALLGLDTAAQNRVFHGIDPYESLETNYIHSYKDSNLRERTERVLRAVIEDAYAGIYHFFRVTSRVYCEQVADPLWSYALVHLDGEHHTETVCQEARFFGPRISAGGILMVDNCDQIEHPRIDEIAESAGLTLVDVLYWRDVVLHREEGHIHAKPLRKAYQRLRN
jgi:hypothetical protein